jgi:hypothetical protein
MTEEEARLAIMVAISMELKNPKADNDARKFAMAMSEKVEKQLREENAELKDYRLTTLAKQQTDMSKYALNLEHKLSWYDDQLTKAKVALRKVIDYLGQFCSDYPDCVIEAEQFLKDSQQEE